MKFLIPLFNISLHFSKFSIKQYTLYPLCGGYTAFSSFRWFILEKSVVRKVCISTLCSCFSLWTHTFSLFFMQLYIYLNRKTRNHLHISRNLTNFASKIFYVCDNVVKQLAYIAYGIKQTRRHNDIKR